VLAFTAATALLLVALASAALLAAVWGRTVVQMVLTIYYYSASR
jgi:hypothetical protein